jgi:hypothetical protein
MKKLSFTLLFSLCSIWAQSQTNAYLKVANNGNFFKIEKVSTGGYITISEDSVHKTQVVCWDAIFNIKWKYTFADAVGGTLCRIVEANDGNFYFMAGYSQKTLIIKFNSIGTILWQKYYAPSTGSLLSISLSKATAGDNGFLFLSQYGNLVKCTQDGNIEWQKNYSCFNATGVINCNNIIPDGSGYVVTIHYNISWVLTFKISSTGTVGVQSVYSHPSETLIPIRMVKLNSTGGYALLGSYNSNNQIIWVAFYNNSLSLQSFNELTVTYNEFSLLDMVAVDNGNNVIISGGINEASIWNTAIVKLSNTGTIVWKKRSEAVNASFKAVYFWGLTANGNNTVHVGSGPLEGRIVAVIDNNGDGLCNDKPFSISNIQSSLNTQTETILASNANISKTDITTTYNKMVSYNKQILCGNLSGIDNETEPTEGNITLYPNPATTTLTIVGISNITKAEIYDISGKLLLSKQLNTNQLDISTLAKGLYFIKLSTAEGSVVRKFVKE